MLRLSYEHLLYTSIKQSNQPKPYHIQLLSSSNKIHGILQHFVVKKSYAGVLLIDCSSALNSINPPKLHFKLNNDLELSSPIFN